MTALEIILLILGVAFIIISCFIIDRGSSDKKDAGTAPADPEGLAKIGEDIKQNINGEAGRIIADAQDKLESISNDKIIAVGEYSDQVMEKIEADHKEVVFLYQMLCDKEEELKEMTDRMSTLKTECERVLMEEKQDTERKEDFEAELKKIRAEFEEEREREREEIENERAREREELELEKAKAREALERERELLIAQAEREIGLNTTMKEEKPAVKREKSRAEVLIEQTGREFSVKSSETVEPEKNTEETAEEPSVTEDKAKPKKQKSSTAKSASDKTKSVSTRAKQGTAGNASPSGKSASVREGGWDSLKAADSRDTRMLSRNDEIIALYKQNKSVTEISRLLQMGQGEVKLIIDLYCR